MTMEITEDVAKKVVETVDAGLVHGKAEAGRRGGRAGKKKAVA